MICERIALMKKGFRFFTSFLTLLCVLASLSSVCFAVRDGQDPVRGGLTYRLSEDETYYTVIGYETEMSSYTILTNVDGIPVTAIEESAFQNNIYVNSITVSSTITVIGKAAFRGCKNLAKITFNGVIEALPDECFYDCKILTEVNLPKGLISIGDDCFKNCSMLGSLKIPASVTSIGHDAFLNCESILLDVSENEYAARYAEAENVNTDFTNTTAFFIILIVCSLIVGFILFVILSKVLGKYFEKHPKQNPAPYIAKFFGCIGKGIGFIFGKIKTFLLFLLKKLEAFLTFIYHLFKKKRDTTDDDDE